jgi:hypothetical protein
MRMSKEFRGKLTSGLARKDSKTGHLTSLGAGENAEEGGIDERSQGRKLGKRKPQAEAGPRQVQPLRLGELKVGQLHLSPEGSHMD